MLKDVTGLCDQFSTKANWHSVLVIKWPSNCTNQSFAQLKPAQVSAVSSFQITHSLLPPPPFPHSFSISTFITSGFFLPSLLRNNWFMYLFKITLIFRLVHFRCLLQKKSIPEPERCSTVTPSRPRDAFFFLNHGIETKNTRTMTRKLVIQVLQKSTGTYQQPKNPTGTEQRKEPGHAATKT